MVKNNAKNRKTYIYSTPQFVNGSWWAWFTDTPFDLLLEEPISPEAMRIKKDAD